MLKREKNIPKSILSTFLISSTVIILSTGVTAGAAISHTSPSSIPLFKHNETGENIPYITELNEEQAQQALQKYGFPFVITKTGENIPYMVGLNEEQAHQALQKHGFPFVITKT